MTTSSIPSHQRSIADAVDAADAVIGYMSRDELTWHATTAARVNDGDPITWIEIGTHRGRSATAVALALPPGSTLLCIDNFHGPGKWTHADPAIIRGFCTTRLAALRAQRPDIIIRLREQPSLVAAAELLEAAPRSADVVFVDGDHKPPYAARDIRAYRRLVREGGLLTGHDYAPGFYGVELAVAENLPLARQVPGTSIFTATVRHLSIGKFNTARFLDLLRGRQPITWSRWGDGEWSALIGRDGGTKDGQVYTPALRDDLRRTLRSAATLAPTTPAYRLGLQRFAVKRFADPITCWLEQEAIWPSWADADGLVDLSTSGHIGDLVDVLRGRPVVVVGPEYFSRFASRFPSLDVRSHHVVPATNAHADLGLLLRATGASLHKWRDAAILVSAGPMAKILLHRLHQFAPGATLLDCGSVWDPYLGKVTRAYHESIRTREAATVGAG